MAYRIIAYIELVVTIIVGISIFSKSPSEITWQEVQELIKDEKVDVVAQGSSWENDENTIYIYLEGQRRGYYDIDNRIPKYYFNIDSDSEFEEIKHFVYSQKNDPFLNYDYNYESSFKKFLMAMVWVFLGFALIYTVALGVKIENGEPISESGAKFLGGVLIAVAIVLLIGIISLIVWIASFGVAVIVGGLFLLVMPSLFSVVLFGR